MTLTWQQHSTIGGGPMFTVAKVQNVCESEYVPNYLQRFCEYPPNCTYYFTF